MKTFYITIFAILISFSALAFEQSEKVNIDGVTTSYKTTYQQNTIYITSALQPLSIKAIKDLGIKSIINLQSNNELTFDEKSAVTKTDIAYENFPVDSQNIDQALVKKFSTLLEQQKNYPVLIHCSSANRAAAMIALHNIQQGTPVEKAISQAKNFGLTKSDLVEKIKTISQK